MSEGAIKQTPFRHLPRRDVLKVELFAALLADHAHEQSLLQFHAQTAQTRQPTPVETKTHEAGVDDGRACIERLRSLRSAGV